MKNYSGCPKKLAARFETIINIYRQHFSDSLPENKQYWTMCAMHTDDQGHLGIGSELDQMLKSGIVSADQFHGVNIEADIITANFAGIPEAHWHLGDFHRTMIAAKNAGEFNPGIVNCDHIKMPQSGGAEDVAKLLAFLSDQTDLILVSNLILKPPRNNAICTTEDYIDALCEYPQFKYAINHGWQHEDAIYVYGGTGSESRTVLGTMVFWR